MNLCCGKPKILRRIALSLNACVRSTKSILAPARAAKGHKTPAHTTAHMVLMRAQPYAHGVFEQTIRLLLGWMKRGKRTPRPWMILCSSAARVQTMNGHTHRPWWLMMPTKASPTWCAVRTSARALRDKLPCKKPSAIPRHSTTMYHCCAMRRVKNSQKAIKPLS